MGNEFTVPSVSISGAPTIEFHVRGDTCRAECAGAKLYAETRSDGGADLRITDAKGEVLADLVVNPRSHRDLTENLVDIGSALLWSHWRFTQASPMSTEAGEHAGGVLTTDDRTDEP